MICDLEIELLEAIPVLQKLHVDLVQPFDDLVDVNKSILHNIVAMRTINLKFNILACCCVCDVYDLVKELIVFEARGFLPDYFLFDFKVVWLVNDLLSSMLLHFDSHPFKHVFVGALVRELSAIFGLGIWSNINDPWKPVDMISRLDLRYFVLIDIDEDERFISVPPGHFILKQVPTHLKLFTMRTCLPEHIQKHMLDLIVSFGLDAFVFELVPSVHLDSLRLVPPAMTAFFNVVKQCLLDTVLSHDLTHQCQQQ